MKHTINHKTNQLVGSIHQRSRLFSVWQENTVQILCFHKHVINKGIGVIRDPGILVSSKWMQETQILRQKRQLQNVEREECERLRYQRYLIENHTKTTRGTPSRLPNSSVHDLQHIFSELLLSKASHLEQFRGLKILTLVPVFFLFFCRFFVRHISHSLSSVFGRHCATYFVDRIGSAFLLELLKPWIFNHLHLPTSLLCLCSISFELLSLWNAVNSCQFMSVLSASAA